MALTNKLTAIGDAIRAKTGTTELLSLDDMATAISNIQTGSGGDLYDYIPESAFNIAGACNNYFAGKGWEWFIDKYGDRITTNSIINCEYMFYKNSCAEIPFDINLEATPVACNYMFSGASIITPPYINGKVSNLKYLFSDSKVVSIPENWADHIDWSYIGSETYADISYMFNYCCCLKKIPDSLISNLCGTQTYSQSQYYYGFFCCYVLSEINNLTVNNAIYLRSAFLHTFDNCHRLKNITFALQEDGTPYTATWKAQTIDLTTNVGYAGAAGNVTMYSYYHGFTTAKQVTDADTYEALKNTDDWWTANIEYSRYNHDSAVATINSLPDTSAYLEANGGTNTIKFKGESGSSTDGGAINTLTEEEIAVATAKGWTVTLV